MSRFGAPKTSKKQSDYKTPYVTFYPHSKPASERTWDPSYYQVVSIDPAFENYAIRIERRYTDGRIIPIVFYKASIFSVEEAEQNTIVNTYQKLTKFLNQYKQFYFDCHFIIIEKQMPQNHQMCLVAQHTISYFSLLLEDAPLLPSIILVDPKLKGRMLGAPKGINYTQLKAWSIEKAQELLKMRDDQYSMQIMQSFKKKMDDLADTVCQIEAVFLSWGFPGTKSVPEKISNAILISNVVPSTSSVVLNIAREKSENVTSSTPNLVLNITREKSENVTSSDTRNITPVLNIVQKAPIRPLTLTINK